MVNSEVKNGKPADKKDDSGCAAVPTQGDSDEMPDLRIRFSGRRCRSVVLGMPSSEGQRLAGFGSFDARSRVIFS